ncbi:MAG TPA: hypothetical protein VM553_14135 [Dongiaceae bacterium]|nr:hypothetical protein [Dongiaceae bacterium]
MPTEEQEHSTTMNDLSQATQLTQLSQAHVRGCLRSLTAVRLYLQADLCRYHGGSRLKFLRHFLFTPGFQYTVWMRLTGWAIRRPATKFTVGILLKMLLSRCRYKYGIAIPEYTDVGPGLFINRFGGIYINGDVSIGHNCNIAQMIIIGQTNRGDNAGSPVIGSQCYVAAGSCLIGRISIGDGSVIANNAVVTKNVPAGSVMGGVPAKVISSAGSEGYINRKAPDELLRRCYEAQGVQNVPVS